MRHGEHGFLVDSEDEMVDAIRRAAFIDRRRCREWAATRFSVGRMVDGYEHAYQTVLARASSRARWPASLIRETPQLAVEARR